MSALNANATHTGARQNSGTSHEELCREHSKAERQTDDDDHLGRRAQRVRRTRDAFGQARVNVLVNHIKGAEQSDGAFCCSSRDSAGRRLYTFNLTPNPLNRSDQLDSYLYGADPYLR